MPLTHHSPWLHDLWTRREELSGKPAQTDPLADGTHCGKCDACRLRAKGFAEAGIEDPTAYA